MDKGKSPSTPIPDASSVTDLPPTLANLLGSSYISTTKLNGSPNFLQWSAFVTTFLLSKDKLYYIEVMPPLNPDAEWIREDAQVRSWLWNSMEPHINSDVVLLKTAHEVYALVADSFASDKNVNRIFELCDEIFRTKQQGRSLKDYYSFVKGRWEDLSLYQPYPKDIETWKHQREQLKVVSFLAGLDAPYASSRNQFLTWADLPTLSVTFLACLEFLWMLKVVPQITLRSPPPFVLLLLLLVVKVEVVERWWSSKQARRQVLRILQFSWPC